MKIKLLLLAFFISFAQANEISLNWLKEKPKTYARDFYILQYLKQENVTPLDAQDALGLVNRMNNKLLFAYINKLNHDESTAVAQCMKMKADDLVNSYADCIVNGLRIKKALTLDSLQLDQVITKVKEVYPKYAKALKIINSPIVFSKLMATDKDTFYTLFLKSSRSFRINKLNYRLSTRMLQKIQDDKRFETLLRYVITNPKMDLSQKSFFKVNDTKLSSNSSFLLAINLITHNKENEALTYLDHAYKKSYFQSDRDKVLFWKYQITKNEDFLQQILSSWDINIYTLYAQEFYDKTPKSIFYDVKQKEMKSTYDIENQFSWIKVIRDTKEVTQEKLTYYEDIFTTPFTKPHLTFLYSKYHRYKKHYFINPYESLIKDFPLERQVLINSIARQESSFIPSSISTAYAQGVMQIMPFLSKHIAQKIGDNYSIYNMFKPEYSISYANIHLNSLEKRFQHPLLIAYAYNGGGGFTSSIMKNGLFKKGKYEPFLSMEKVPYNETKEYGKKVLTNYIIYNNQYNKEKVKITTLLENLPTLSQLESK